MNVHDSFQHVSAVMFIVMSMQGEGRGVDGALGAVPHPGSCYEEDGAWQPACTCACCLSAGRRCPCALYCQVTTSLPNHAPSLSGILIPLLLYIDDLIIMSSTAAGLQRQLDALQQFCHQRQLSVNLAKTKVVTFGSKGCMSSLCVQ